MLRRNVVGSMDWHKAPLTGHKDKKRRILAGMARNRVRTTGRKGWKVELPSETQDFERCASIASKVLTHLNRRNIPATPQNYSLWYAFFSGEDPKLKETLKALIDADVELDDVRHEEVYNEFFGDTQKFSRVEEWADRIDQAASQIRESVNATGEDAAQYGAILKNVPSNLANASDDAAVQNIISDLLSETKAMHGRMRELEGRVVNSSSEIDDLRSELEDARKDALTDGLTGVANRKSFDMMLDRALLEADETSEPLSLIIVDLDHFKAFNDTHGHQVGDKVLRLVAHTMTDSVKGRDTVSRYGGEEFAIILPNTDAKGAGIVAEQIRTSVAAKKLVRRGTDEVLGRITVSLGIATRHADEPKARLITRADSALYEAKNLGRNQAVCQNVMSTAA